MHFRARWAVLRADGSQHGVAVSVGMAVIIPIFLLLTFGGISLSQWSHAREVARTAAQHGVEQARVLPYDADRGVAEAQRFIDAHGQNALTAVAVTATVEDDGTITITITGDSQTAVPGWNPGVRVSAAAPLEGEQ